MALFRDRQAADLTEKQSKPDPTILCILCVLVYDKDFISNHKGKAGYLMNGVGESDQWIGANYLYHYLIHATHKNKFWFISYLIVKDENV